jgi:hypothetical protein
MLLSIDDRCFFNVGFNLEAEIFGFFVNIVPLSVAILISRTPAYKDFHFNRG